MRKLLAICLLSSAIQCNACEENVMQKYLDVMEKHIYEDEIPKYQKVHMLLETSLKRIMIKDNEGMHRDMEYLYLLCEKHSECMYELIHTVYGY
jgi:hypothetical protein